MAKKIILILVIVLIVLILITSFISNLFKNKKPTTEIKNVIPTATVNYNSNQNQNKLNPTEKAKQLIINKIISQIKIFPKADLETLSKLNKTLPFKSDDFDVEYSPYLNQYFVSKKTPDADKKIALWATNNSLSELIKNENLFIFTDQPAADYRNQAEQIIVNVKQQALLTPFPSPTTATSSSIPQLSITPSEQPDLSLLIDLLNAFFSIGTNLSTLEAVPGAQPSGGQLTVQQTNLQYSTVPQSLTQIFSEVSQKVGAPIKILEAVLRIEYPSTFNLSQQEIGFYSTPGNSMSGEYLPNVCSATGPMQMTIGYDRNGSSLCPKCCWEGSCLDTKGGCPNAWASYARAVNTYGGYTHQPNPLNLKDNIYAAALKLKTDSAASDPVNWTQDQVYQASLRYYGSCSENARYERLGNRTYCEFVWWYYKNQ